ncbi:MAG TPA: NAD(P)-binding domain-containing protein [bacterium]|nr:NAD(P)-binding domain-containing protein [bacterium]
MNVGILGSGEVGQALGRGFLTLEHRVMLGSRDAENAKGIAWAKQSGARASHGTFTQAARFGEIVALATLGVATENAIRLAGPEHFAGKLVLDATNPLDFSKGMPPGLVGGVGDSAGEKHQRLLPEAHVVKAFNTVGNPLFFRPQLPGGPPSMLICGNDAGAKKQTAQICKDFGWDVVDVGPIAAAHYLEAMCLVWLFASATSNNWHQAFKLLRK